jgi:hypothetical protein
MGHLSNFITVQTKENADIEIIAKEIGLTKVKPLRIKNFYSAESIENTNKQIEELNKRNDVVIAYMDCVIALKKEK